MTISQTPQLAIGVDIGATKIAGALVNRRGVVLDERRMPTCAADGSTAVIRRVSSLVHDLLASSREPVAGIGVGTPGYVDPQAGVVTNAVNLGWERVYLVDELRRELGTELEIWAENDANVMALGEYHFGAAMACGDFVYASIGSGLGSGIMVGHRLVSGADFRAAELGHLSLDPNGRKCACGLRGCVETVVSGPGILATAHELLAAGNVSVLQDLPGLTTDRILQAAVEGDRLALRVFEYTAEWLGQALSACLALLNPQRIIIGGGMGLAAFELLVPGVRLEFERRLIPMTYANVRLVRSEVHSSAVGASSVVWNAIRNHHAA